MAGMEWYPRNPRAALRGMEGLTLEERGAYDTLLDLIYDRGEPYPDDERKLAGLMGVSVRKWKTIRDSLLAKQRIVVRDTPRGPALSDERAEIELENQASRRRLNAESGAKGGRKSAEAKAEAKENNDLGQAVASVPLKHKTETETERTPKAPKGAPVPDRLVEAIWSVIPVKSRARTSRADIASAMKAAVDRGRDPEAIAATLASYYATADATKENGQFAKTAHRLIERDRWMDLAAPTPLEALAAKADPLDVWRRRVRAYLTGSRYWNTNDWEAAPGKPGCIVPAVVLAEFNIAPLPSETHQGVAA